MRAAPLVFEVDGLNWLTTMTGMQNSRWSLTSLIVFGVIVVVAYVLSPGLLVVLGLALIFVVMVGIALRILSYLIVGSGAERRETAAHTEAERADSELEATRQRLRDIIEEFPDTQVAAEAEALLEDD